MFLHWLLLVSLANSCAGSLELLELRNTVKQPKGLCGDIFSSCVWFFFDSLRCGMFLHDVSKSPSIFANFPIYGYKDEFLLPPHDHLFFPAAGTAVSALMCLPFLREFYISQSLSRSSSYNTALRKQALVQPENSRLPVDPITAVAGWLYWARSFNHF